MITREHPGGKIEISVFWPGNDKESRTGWTVALADLDKTLRDLAIKFKRGGSRVTHVHIGR